MRDSSKKVLLGMLSGSLVTMGFGLAFSPALIFVSFHHMFLLGVQPRGVAFVLLVPMLLVVAGLFVALRTLENGRRAIGTLLLLLPILAFVGVVPLAVLIGSLGMDIHWTSKVPLYVAGTCFLLAFSGCMAVGIRLRRIGQDEKIDG